MQKIDITSNPNCCCCCHGGRANIDAHSHASCGRKRVSRSQCACTNSLECGSKCLSLAINEQLPQSKRMYRNLSPYYYSVSKSSLAYNSALTVFYETLCRISLVTTYSSYDSRKVSLLLLPDSKSELNIFIREQFAIIWDRGKPIFVSITQLY